MPKDTGSTGRFWLKKLTQGLSAEPQDRAELLKLLAAADQRMYQLKAEQKAGVVRMNHRQAGA